MAFENEIPEWDAADFYHSRFVEHGERVFVRLRKTLDEAEFAFTHRQEGPYREGEYSRAAAELLHAMDWGRANLSIEMLVQSASQADIEAVKKQIRQESE